MTYAQAMKKFAARVYALLARDAFNGMEFEAIAAPY
jgi:hypothetical protein